MATRPVFTPTPDVYPYVRVLTVKFQWHAGLSMSQMQKSVASLHESASKAGYGPVLEISTRSLQRPGVALSAFNLKVKLPNGRLVPVESAYQGSKVFRNGGPFTDLYEAPARDAKQDSRLRDSGELVGFNFNGVAFALQPATLFYDWIYLQGLALSADLAAQLLLYKSFSDIAFNPEKSTSCQAKSAALFVALRQLGVVDRLLDDVSAFKEFLAFDARGHSRTPRLL